MAHYMDIRNDQHSDEVDMDVDSLLAHLASDVRASTVIPTKSRKLYEKQYNKFTAWRIHEMKASQTNEEITLAYFSKLANSYKASSLMSIFTRLRSMIILHEKIDISQFSQLIAFLKRKIRVHQPVQAWTFTNDDISKFIAEAPDNQYLAHKVVVIFGIYGGLRGDELLNVECEHITRKGSVLKIMVPSAKTDATKSFILSNECVPIVEKYLSLRPTDAHSLRFFIHYVNNSCTRQNIGKNRIAAMPKEIAEFLKLPYPNRYTVHSFRRSSKKTFKKMQSTLEQTIDDDVPDVPVISSISSSQTVLRNRPPKKAYREEITDDRESMLQEGLQENPPIEFSGNKTYEERSEEKSKVYVFKNCIDSKLNLFGSTIQEDLQEVASVDLSTSKMYEEKNNVYVFKNCNNCTFNFKH